MNINPCPLPLDQMPGNEKRRYCAQCGHSVHARGAYSDSEWAALLQQDRVCAYWWGESAAAPRSRRVIVAGALLTTISPLLAQNGSLTVHAVDPTGGAITGGRVFLVATGGKEVSLPLNEKGEAVFAGLPAGNCTVRVEAQGFQMWRQEAPIAGAVHLQATLAIGKITMGIVLPDKPKRRWFFQRRG